MDDLIAWYRAQLNDESGLAKAAGGGCWVAEPQTHGSYAVAWDGEPVVYDEGAPTEAQAHHIARWAPARALREVDAKRHILDAYAELSADRDRLTDAAKHLTWTLLGNVVRTLAAAMDDRPGYRNEWRP